MATASERFAAPIFERIVETIFLTVFSVLSVVLLAAVRKIVKLQLNSRLRSANSFATILSNAFDK